MQRAKIDQKQPIFFSSILFVAILFGFSFSDWVMQNPPLTGSSLNGITTKKDGSIWIIGDHGEIISSLAGSYSWRKYLNPSGNRLYSICFGNDGRGWAVGGIFGRPYALVSEDGGQTWNSLDLPDDFTSFLKVCCSKNGDIWIFGEYHADDSTVNTDALVFSKDSTTWERISFEKKARIRDIAFISDSLILAVGPGYIGQSVNYGKNWRKVSPEKVMVDTNIFMNYTDVVMFGQDTGYILNYFGQVLKTVDGGNTWKVSFQIIGGHFNSMSFKTAEIGLVFGYFIASMGMSEVFFTLDGGEHWTSGLIKVNGIIKDFVFVTGRSGIACTATGSIFKIEIIDNKTMTCDELTRKTGLFINDIDGYNDSCLIAASLYDSTILITTTGGNDWEVVEVPCLAKKVFYFDSEHITIAGDKGQLYQASGSNSKWSAGQLLGGIPFSSSKKGDCAILTNNKRECFLTVNAGEEWKKLMVPFTEDKVPSGSFIYDSNNIWLFTNKGRIAFTEDKGGSWRQIHPDIFGGTGGLGSMLFISDKIGFVAGDGPDKTSLLYKTIDGGHSWIKKNSFTFLPNSYTPLNANLNHGIKMIASGNNSDIWFITTFEVFHSSDTGETWISQAYPQYVTWLTDIYCSASGNCWIAGLNWSIFHYRPNSMSINNESFQSLYNSRFYNGPSQPFSVFDLLGRHTKKIQVDYMLITKKRYLVEKEISIRRVPCVK